MHSFSITYFRFSKNIASVDDIIFNLNWKEWPISGERMSSFVLCDNVLRGLSRVVELKEKFLLGKAFSCFFHDSSFFFYFRKFLLGGTSKLQIIFQFGCQRGVKCRLDRSFKFSSAMIKS